MKDQIEEALFDRRRDLCTAVGLVFFDTTSIYFEGNGGESVGQYGHSKDHRPDRRQMIVGVAVDCAGRPLCCEMWPGNPTDAKTFPIVVERMRSRFRVQELYVVADRGMVSAQTLAAFEAMEPPVHYIVGVRIPVVGADDGQAEGTGVKFRSAAAYKNGANRAIQALRIEDTKDMRTYFGYFYDETEKRWI